MVRSMYVTEASRLAMRGVDRRERKNPNHLEITTMIIGHNHVLKSLRILGMAAALLLVTTAAAWGGKVSLVEDGATRYTVSIDGVVLAHDNGAPKLFTPMASATEVAKIHLQANPDAKVVITGIQRWHAEYSTRKKGRNKVADEPEAPQEPVEPDAPAEPEEPQEPEAPVEPDAPAEPDGPQEPVAPQEPDAPVEPKPEEPGDLEPVVNFPDRLVAKPTIDLDALIANATHIWVSADGRGDGSSAENTTTLDSAVKKILAAGGGHYVVRLANGEKHMMSMAWPIEVAGESADAPIVLMPANPQGLQPIIVGAGGAPAVTFQTPRHIVAHGIQFGSHLAEAVRVNYGADGSYERGLTFDGCTFFGSKHGLTASSLVATATSVQVTVRNSLFADNREAAIVATRVKSLKILNSSIAFASPPKEMTPAIDLIASELVTVSDSVITRASGPAVRVNGGATIRVRDNAFVANAASGELVGRPDGVQWVGNVTINSLAGANAAGLCVRSVRAGIFYKNLFVNSHGVGGPAIVIGRDVSDGDENVSGATFSENIIYDAHDTALQVDWVVAENIAFDSNVTQSSGAISQPSMAAKWVSANVAPGISATGGRFALATVGNAVRVGDTSGGYELWTQLTGGNVETAPVNFVDPKRDAAIYNRVAMDGEEDADALVESIRSGHVEADPLVQWVRAGFEIVAIEDEPQDPPVEPEDPPVEPEDPPVEPEEPPVEPEDPPVVPEDPPIGVDRVAIYVDSPTGPTSGNDANDGASPQTAVAGWERAKEIAYEMLVGEPRRIPVFLLNRGDEFSAFGKTVVKRRDQANWQAKELYGTADEPVIFAPYGKGANPVFVAQGGAVFEIRPHSGRIEWHSIDGNGAGLFVSSISVRGELALYDCVINGMTIMGQPYDGGPKRATGFMMKGCTVKNVVAHSGGHTNGVFLDRLDGIVLIDNVIYNNGWEADGVSGSALSQGVYITGECGPTELAEGNVFIRNAGAGAQFRSAGVVRNNFAAWNGARAINWGQTLGAKTGDVGGTGEFVGNVCYQRPILGGGAALAVGNLSSGRITGNTIVNYGANQALLLDSDHGDNHRGGIRVGLNSLVISGNVIQGGIRLEYGGWGAEGGDGVHVTGNNLQGEIDAKTSFDDAEGKLVIDGGQDPAPMLPEPVLTEGLVESVLARTTTAEQLIDTYRAK